MIAITMPRLSDSMQEGTILSWLREDGEEVKSGEELLEIETDKATMTYESPSSGVLEIVAAVGETHPVGAVIAQLAAAGEATPADPAAGSSESDDTGSGGADPAGAGRATAEPVGAEPAGGQSGRQPADNGASPAVKATPLARRLARAHDVDLGALDGSGPRGRIMRSDVIASVGVEADPSGRGSEQQAGTEGASGRGNERRGGTDGSSEPVGGQRSADGQTEPGGGQRSADGETAPRGGERTTVVEPTRLQQVIARRMTEAKATIPEFQVQTETRMDALIVLREELKALGQEPVPSLNDFIVKACALALRRHPRANGSYRDGRFELHEQVHVGVAVAATDELVVPTITDADERSVRSIASESRRLAERVRDATVTPSELSGATFTVSNLGMYGMTAITPVINPPQAAILGVGASRSALELRDGRLVERQVLTLTLSCDHRILYGADAASFLSDIRAGLEAPLRLML